MSETSTKKVEEKVVNKVTPEELAQLTELFAHRQKLLTQIGDLEVKKQELLKEADKLKLYIDGKGKELETKYGKINVDLKSGEYTLIEKQDGNKS